jgi:vitamin B12/bleomycin/antimicrobial peptide transport system ATP-binding/permease protein
MMLGASTRRNRLGETRQFLRRLLRLALPYFARSEERWRARLLLVVIVALTLGAVFLNVRLNDWNRRFFEMLQNKDIPSFLPLILEFSVLAAIYIVIAVYRLYLRQMLQMRWRVWLTSHMIGRWLDDKVYYQLELEDRRTDNPDQRIAEDLNLFTADTLGIALGLLSSFVTLVSFTTVLWTISGSVTVPLGEGITVPGYMVWVSIAYAVVGSMLTHFIARRLIPLNFEQQRREADFRYGLVRVRENAEGVALYGGEGPEGTELLGRVDRIRANWWRIMDYTKRLTFYVSGYSQIAIIFPYLVAAPRYLAGEISLGVLTQTSGAFAQVEGTLSWFINNYDALAGWKATVDRLLTFDEAVDRHSTETQSTHGVEVIRDGAGSVRAEHLQLRLPTGRLVLDNANFEIRPGDRLLVRGPTGVGKSTLFRAIAGIWPFGDGRIVRTDDAHVLFLPQRPYLPLMTLRAAVSYPSPSGTFTDEDIVAALSAVNLDAFADRLDLTQNWSLQMSGGEQQRLALARALLRKPAWLFLDEATSAIDTASEDQLYQTLLRLLPDTTIVSIAHRENLAAFHNRQFMFHPNGGMAELVVV